MRKSRFTEEQMVKILREADKGPVEEVAKRHGVSSQSIVSKLSPCPVFTAAACCGWRGGTHAATARP
jgi:hypothetical protein